MEQLKWGVRLTPLKVIFHEKGDIMHALKASEIDFNNFGEAYFSNIIPHEIKGWKKHLKMSLNLIVPCGSVRFVIHNNPVAQKVIHEYIDVTIGELNYGRLFIPPGLWVAFQGTGESRNMLLNMADIEHDREESVNANLSNFEFTW
jgi:dTDP-4-dehydrorhamnose 3,5-epimerase